MTNSTSQPDTQIASRVLPSPALDRQVLGEQVRLYLTRSILNGHYPPGSRIVAATIARDLGVSQGPVREAIRDVEALGLVETVAHRGCWVRKPYVSELLEAFAVRAALEALAARLAVARLTDAGVRELAQHLGDMRRAARAGDTHHQAMSHATFHRWIIEAASNTTLVRLWGQLEPYSGTHAILRGSPDERIRIADLHQPLLDAIRAGASNDAEQALHRHYAQAAERLRDVAPD